MDYERCFDQNQCFGYPEGCINNKTCEMMTSLKITGDKVDVQLVKSVSDWEEYVAMAFSDDNKMGKDLVFACSYSWMRASSLGIYVNMLWNEGRSQPSMLQEERKVIRNSTGNGRSIAGAGRLVTCNFTLEKDVTVKGKRFDFEKGHHILLAAGKTNNDTLFKHDNKVASKSKFGKYENQTGTYIL